MAYLHRHHSVPWKSYWRVLVRWGVGRREHVHVRRLQHSFIDKVQPLEMFVWHSPFVQEFCKTFIESGIKHVFPIIIVKSIHPSERVFWNFVIAVFQTWHFHKVVFLRTDEVVFNQVHRGWFINLENKQILNKILPRMFMFMCVLLVITLDVPGFVYSTATICVAFRMIIKLAPTHQTEFEESWQIEITLPNL